jgi:hypothetical protein
MQVKIPNTNAITLASRIKAIPAIKLAALMAFR